MSYPPFESTPLEGIPPSYNLSTEQLITDLRLHVKENDLGAIKLLLNNVSVNLLESESFFRDGIFINLIAKYCEIPILEYVKTVYVDCMAIMIMPVIINKDNWESIRRTNKAVLGEIISIDYLNEIPQRNLNWLIKNKCLSDVYSNIKGKPDEKAIIQDKQLVDEICNFIMFETHQKMINLYSKIDLENTHQKTFFHEGKFICLVAKYCNINTLNYIKNIYHKQNCQKYFTITDIYKNDINKLSQEKIQWLTDNNCLKKDNKKIPRYYDRIIIIILTIACTLCIQNGYGKICKKNR